jgi:hypothetical protein
MTDRGPIKRLPALLCLLAGVLGAGPTLYAATPYVFSHGFDNASEKAQTPRGGTTRGAPVELDDTVPAAYHDIQAPGLDKRERDARAIRALAGDYRATFEFIETAALAPGIERDARPYRSWATERVFVIADTPTEIELQHIMVMRFVDDEGAISDPMVMKHWRQRWQWQPARSGATPAIAFGGRPRYPIAKPPGAGNRRSIRSTTRCATKRSGAGTTTMA